jgi:prepilin-type N-terminal cleavage/methylation domain-containing protein
MKKLLTYKGFTLVEVIVVLVILAILAAIAIPALTGYIDKARARATASEGRAVLMGLQTLVTLEYGDGNATPQAGGGEYFYNNGNGRPSEISARFDHIFYRGLTEKGAKELSDLTGIPYADFADWTPDSADISIANPWGISAFGTPGSDVEITYFVYHSNGNMIVYDPNAEWYNAVNGSSGFPNINKSLARSGTFSICAFDDYDADVHVTP